MKTFRLFATMMIVAICAGFTSCSNDDDENNNGYSKKIVSGTDTDISANGNNSTSNFTIEYDAQGRVTKRIDDYSTEQYTYDTNEIICDSYNNLGLKETTIYTLENGLIVSKIYDNRHTEYKYGYTYDSENRLSKRIYTWGKEETIKDYIWKDGNIVSCIEKNGYMGGNFTTTYTYTDIPFHHLGGYTWTPGEVDAILMAQGYFGKCIKNLIMEEYYLDKEEPVLRLTYQLDKDRYVAEMTIKEVGYPEEGVYQFTWQ